MQVYKYASIPVCQNASTEVCKYAMMQVYMYASMQLRNYAIMQVGKYTSMQVCKDASSKDARMQVYSYAHMGGSTQPLQKFAAAGENCDFVIAVIFYPVKQTF